MSAPVDGPGAAFTAVRADRLRTLRRAHRMLWGVVLAPFVLVACAVVSIGHLDDPGTHLGLLLLIGTVVAVVPLLFVFGLAVQSWAERSYVHRHSDAKLREVDWAAPTWSRVREVFVTAGLDPTALRAVTVWDRGNLRTRHIARPTSHRLMRLGDLTVPHQRLLLTVGTVLGLTAGVFSEQLSTVTDTKGFAVCVFLVLAALLPVAVHNGSRQIQLNLRNPDTVLLIPAHWRPRLRRDPAATVQLLHEISHIRHQDPGNRRLLAVCPDVSQALAFFATAPVIAIAGPPWPVLLAFGCVAALGVLAVRRAVRLIPVVHEVRADAEACLDAAATAHMREFLRVLQQTTPTAAKALRIASLTGGPTPTALRRELTLIATMAGTYALAVGGVAVGALMGLVPASV
ncbi:hypothetical protein AAHZ94_02575 [Streptomyces sp. HSW2009]|uniref:hypothetical protein n=1 Tax=Streptomyces sp. HSW2009 TaxID=3142890 RepID=UPI0032ED7A8D